VVDAPEAKFNSEYSVNPLNYHHPNLSLASGATALGSVKPRHLSQLQTDPLPTDRKLIETLFRILLTPDF
jgi:hypothetical protein